MVMLTHRERDWGHVEPLLLHLLCSNQGLLLLHSSQILHLLNRQLRRWQLVHRRRLLLLLLLHQGGRRGPNQGVGLVLMLGRDHDQGLGEVLRQWRTSKADGGMAPLLLLGAVMKRPRHRRRTGRVEGATGNRSRRRQSGVAGGGLPGSSGGRKLRRQREPV